MKNNNSVKKLVDEYVAIRNDIDSLKLKEKVMRERVLDTMEDKGQETLKGTNDNHITKIEKEKLTVDSKEFRKQVTDGEFMDCVNISTTKARKYVLPEKLEKISMINFVVNLKVK